VTAIMNSRPGTALPEGCASTYLVGADACALGRARAWLARRMQQIFPLSAGDESVDDVMACTGELLANAVQHSDGPGHNGGIRLTLAVVCERAIVRGREEVTRTAIRVTVRDPGNSAGREPAIREPDLASMTGRGLLIVDTLATRWGRERDNAGGHLVWFERDY
jgi:hypothetical protein